MPEIPERRKVRRLPLRLEFREQLALVLLSVIMGLYAIVILVGLFFVRSLDDAIKLLSEVAKVLGPIAGVIVAFYYERER
jgi:capsular polysaccharide biosynthesis protein